MQAEEHNKLLGILHLVYGGMHAFSLIIIVGAFLVFGIMMPFATPDRAARDSAFLVVIMLIVGLFSLVLTIPPLVAGYGFLKRKSWSKVAGAISAALALLSIPMGTALGVYTFWFLFGEKGRQLFAPKEFSWQVGQMREALHGGQRPGNWTGRKVVEQKVEYIPPSEPPDWR